MKPKRKPSHCIKCGRFLGNTNLGGYQEDKTSKRGTGALCVACVDRQAGKDCP